MTMPWFRLYGAEMLADPKYQRLNAHERSCWITLLCLASMNEGVVKHCDEAYLITRSGIDATEIGRVQGVLMKLELLGMIYMGKDDNGVSFIGIKNWEKRQYQNTPMTGYERLKKWRQNKRLKAGDNEMITDDNGKSRTDQNRTDKKEEGASRSFKKIQEDREKLTGKMRISS